MAVTPIDQADIAIKAAKEVAAEHLKTAETVKAATASMTEGFKGLGMDISNASAFLNTMFQDLGQVSGAITSLSGDAGKQSASWSVLSAAAKTLTSDLGLMAMQVTGISKAGVVFQEFSRAGVSGIGNVSKAFQDISGRGAEITNIFGGPIAAAVKLAGAFAEGSQRTRDFENNILRMAASSGQLGDVMQKTGGDFHDLDSVAASWKANFHTIGDATNMFSEEVAALSDTLHKVPDALSSTSNMANASGQSITGLQAVIEVATGTGQKHAEVANRVSDMYLKLGTSTRSALGSIALLSETTNNLHLPLDLAQKTIGTISDQFADLGNNTDSAIKILDRFGTAFKASNLAPDQIEKMIEKMTAGVRSMDIGQKAFMSSQAGGPGGLAGAYRIDQMMREGKLNEVMSMAQDSLKKQFGGKVLTLQEAQRDEATAAQFTRQVKFLQSGAFGKMAQTDADAYRILDAMKAGTGGTALQARTGEEARQKAGVTGEALMDRNTTVLGKVHNALVALDGHTAQMNDNWARSLVGNKNPILEEAQANARKAAGENAATATSDMFGGKRNITKEEAKAHTQEAIKGDLLNLGDVFKQTTKTVSEMKVAWANYGKRLQEAGKEHNMATRALKEKNAAEMLKKEAGLAFDIMPAKPIYKTSANLPHVAAPASVKKGLGSASPQSKTLQNYFAQHEAELKQQQTTGRTGITAAPTSTTATGGGPPVVLCSTCGKAAIVEIAKKEVHNANMNVHGPQGQG